MPVATIDCTRVNDLLQDDNENKNIISTKYGSTLLEIQGELNLPSHKPKDITKLSKEDQEKMSNFITIDNVYDAIKFGHLEFDSKDETKVTLFIGKSQRLIGNLVKLDIPLGILKIPKKQPDESKMDIDFEEGEEEENIQMIDIIQAKLIFKQRPLPIM
ncbi:uncharacterized protein KGF55_002232 [Candida pseudojiufengensis]|uniref:uncharacterized protein n=1 Tax=Candida pseudojiufengensis TaxID=497109 RepID=UPI0022242C9B|nr:uncharacterized protein KGF55_002232 [Candida pseudojiufengensis]KAI5964290.1 hypothetical protein KGF55_002232 [Candida pseudojiufengensis]